MKSPIHSLSAMRFFTAMLLSVFFVWQLEAQHHFAPVAESVNPEDVQHNAGQKSALQQTALLAEVGLQSATKKWAISLRPRTSRDHTGSALDSIKEVKMKTKLASLLPEAPQKGKKATASTPIIGTNFEGNWSITSHPPDNNLAISNGGKIVSVNNDGVEYYDESGNLLFVEIWSDFINDNSLTSTIYDPVVLYDSQEDRFVLAVLHGTQPSTSQVLLLFSKSNDPMGGWHLFTLSGNPLNNNTWFDYPKIGVSGQEIYITGNLYDGNDNFSQSIIYQVGKAEGYAGNSLNWQFWYNLNAQPFPAFTLVPASYGHQGNIGPGMLFVSSNSGGENRIRLWELTDYMSNNPSLNVFITNATPYSPAGDGLMPGTNLTLDNSDNRILNAFYLNGYVHYVFHSDIGQGWNGIHYNRLEVSNLNNQTATLGNAGVEDYSFPVIASFATQASDPTAMVAFLHSSQSKFPSTSVVQCDASMQWSQPAEIKAGDNYVDFLQGNKQRWGDYNGMARKHNSPAPVVWSATSYGTDIVGSSGTLPNTYKTWIAKIQTGPVSTEENQLIENNAAVYPNPVMDLMHIDFTLNKREEIRIEIIDLQGRVVKLLYYDRPKKLENRLSFNRDALAAGHYLLTISNSNETIYREKISIQ